MLQKVRIVTAIICFSLLTLLFLDFTGTLHGWFGWLAKIQFLPALLALNIGIVVALIVLTLLLGRVYCSVICPLGVFQDVISWGASKHKKRRFRYSPAMSWLRYGILALFILAFVVGLAPLVALIEPYSAYGRIANNLFAPFYQLGNNLLASITESIDSYAFYSTEVWIKSGITLGVALITLVAVGYLAWRSGRTYCNTICPVGTVLGFLSRFSIYRPVINTEACTKCNKCARNCKSSCINIKTAQIDYSRCVTCMNCIEECEFGAIKYVLKKPSLKILKQKAKQETIEVTNNSENARRRFLSATTFLAATAAVKAQQQLQNDGGLADIEDKQTPSRATQLVPPGAKGRRHMQKNCTACQLCVAACPNKILRPSSNLSTLMQPEITYERGFCRPECVECSKVCPTGAITEITMADKSAISIGQAVWIKENCIVYTQEVPCTACERHCPTNAITLVDVNPNNTQTPAFEGFGREPRPLKVPAINKELCIGCGACEHLCPARPLSAIYVEGNVMHHTI